MIRKRTLMLVLTGLATFTVSCGSSGPAGDGTLGKVGGSPGTNGTGGAGGVGSPSDRCLKCTNSAACSNNFCNRVASDDLADLVGITPTNLGGVCSEPGDTGKCGCFTGYLTATKVCVGTGCSGTPIDLCDNLSGQEFSGAGTGGIGGSRPGTGSGGAGGGVVGGTGGTGSACSAASSARFTDFSIWDPGTMVWGTTGGPTGGSYTFGVGGSVAATVDTTQRLLHVTGTLVPNAGITVVGAGIYAASCIDASAYGGVQFRFGGSAGASTLQLSATTVSDTCNGATCSSPSSAKVLVPGDVTIRWSDFTGGQPRLFDAHELTGFTWVVTVLSSTTTTTVDFTIGDLTLIP